MNSLDEIRKENQLYYQSEELHDKIVKYFNDNDEGNPTLIDFPTVSAYISQFEKNLKKLMMTSYAGDSTVSSWYDDLAMFKIQKNKQEWGQGLQSASNWILNTYNNFASSKGWTTRISQNGVNNFIRFILRYDNIDTYKNIIKRIITRQMTSSALYRTINSVIFQSNERVEESIEFEFNKKLSLNEGFEDVFDSSLVDYSKDFEKQDLEILKEPIKQFLDEHEIKNYTINDDMTVDVNGDVDLSYCRYRRLPIKFNKVDGNFCCESSHIACLEGFPHIINGSLYAAFSNIFDIENYEIQIKGDCDFSNTPSSNFDRDNFKIVFDGNFWCGEEDDELDIIK